MKEINLRDYYPFYTSDVIVAVPDEVAEESTDSVQNNLNVEPIAKSSKRYRVIRGFKR